MGEAAAEGPGSAEPDHTPLLHPADGMPDLSVTVSQIEAAAALLNSGHGPFAVDAERASGFRYSNRAYLIQIRRANAGTVLIDPVSHGADPLTALRPIAEVLSTDEWILHSADQDLPCLAEVGMRPPALYDTELAGRLAARGVAQLRRPRRGTPHRTARGDLGRPSRARQNRLGGAGIRPSTEPG
jgi:ribonuclease D